MLTCPTCHTPRKTLLFDLIAPQHTHVALPRYFVVLSHQHFLECARVLCAPSRWPLGRCLTQPGSTSMPLVTRNLSVRNVTLSCCGPTLSRYSRARAPCSVPLTTRALSHAAAVPPRCYWQLGIFPTEVFMTRLAQRVQQNPFPVGPISLTLTLCQQHFKWLVCLKNFHWGPFVNFHKHSNFETFHEWHSQHEANEELKLIKQAFGLFTPVRAQVSLVITSWQPVVVTPIEHTTAWGCILNTALKRLSRSSRRHRRWVIQCRPPVNLLQTAVETRRRRAGRAAWSAWSVRSVVAFRALVFATIVLARATMSLLWQRSHRSEGNFQKLKRKKKPLCRTFPLNVRLGNGVLWSITFLYR